MFNFELLKEKKPYTSQFYGIIKKMDEFLC